LAGKVSTESNYSVTAEPTAEPHYDWIIKANQIPDDKLDGVVTLEFKQDTPIERKALIEVYTKLRKAISDLLTKVPPTKTTTEPVTAESVTGTLFRFRREQAASTASFTPDDVTVVAVKPEVKNKHLRTTVYANDKDGGVVSGKHLNEAVQNNKRDVESSVGAIVEDSHVGLPSDVNAELAAEEAQRPKTVWEAHFWLFIALLIFVCIGILLLLILCLCMCCRRLRRSKRVPISQKPTNLQQRPQPLLEEEPLVAAKSRPAMAEQPASHEGPQQDDENGWIIPLDQLTQEELEQTEAPVSKL